MPGRPPNVLKLLLFGGVTGWGWAAVLPRHPHVPCAAPQKKKVTEEKRCWGQHLTISGCACKRSQIHPREIGCGSVLAMRAKMSDAHDRRPHLQDIKSGWRKALLVSVFVSHYHYLGHYHFIRFERAVHPSVLSSGPDASLSLSPFPYAVYRCNPSPPIIIAWCHICNRRFYSSVSLGRFSQMIESGHSASTCSASSASCASSTSSTSSTSTTSITSAVLATSAILIT